ncbi:hypothetical protein UFOVP1605_32 [uncultured Caudovirales phage]|uniref:Uncharacterized protein n=1 Tax=uncultured Caudovirales phage TaxID=2100421 RepID=A0A6J5SSM6_9CAUD|nr:hypothetical protein UFOVP1605_32 [uncultured Caudovirales phage]
MEQLQKIFDKLESMEDRIIAIDTSVRGDDSRGVVGMKQHMASLKKEFHTHTLSDESQFNSITIVQNEIKETFSKVRWWLAGASFIVSSVVVIVGVSIKYLK